MRVTLALCLALVGCGDPGPAHVLTDGGVLIDPRCVEAAGPGTVRVEYLGGICFCTCDPDAPWVNAFGQQCGLMVNTDAHCGEVGGRCYGMQRCGVTPASATRRVGDPRRYVCVGPL